MWKLRFFILYIHCLLLGFGSIFDVYYLNIYLPFDISSIHHHSTGNRSVRIYFCFVLSRANGPKKIAQYKYMLRRDIVEMLSCVFDAACLQKESKLHGGSRIWYHFILLWYKETFSFLILKKRTVDFFRDRATLY